MHMLTYHAKYKLQCKYCAKTFFTREVYESHKCLRKIKVRKQLLKKHIPHVKKAGKFIKVSYDVTYAVMLHQPYTDLKTTRNCVAKKIDIYKCSICGKIIDHILNLQAHTVACKRKNDEKMENMQFVPFQSVKSYMYHTVYQTMRNIVNIHLHIQNKLNQFQNLCKMKTVQWWQW